MEKTSLPDAATLIAAAREAIASVTDNPLDREETTRRRRRAASAALDKWAPAVDEMTDRDGAAAFLGISRDLVKRRMWRARADGTPDWPKPDVEAGNARTWKYRTLAVFEASRPGRGRHGSATAPIPGDAVLHLSVADIAAHFGITANTVHAWRTRYRPGRSLEEEGRAPDCPQPDVIVGLGQHSVAGWRADRLSEWEEWRASLPGTPSGGWPDRRQASRRPPGAGHWDGAAGS